MIFEYLSIDTFESIVPFFEQYVNKCKSSYIEDGRVKKLRLTFQDSQVEIIIAECDENLMVLHSGFDYLRSDLSNITSKEIISDLSLFIRNIKIESII